MSLNSEDGCFELDAEAARKAFQGHSFPADLSFMGSVDSDPLGAYKSFIRLCVDSPDLLKAHQNDIGCFLTYFVACVPEDAIYGDSDNGKVDPAWFGDYEYVAKNMLAPMGMTEEMLKSGEYNGPTTVLNAHNVILNALTFYKCSDPIQAFCSLDFDSWGTGLSVMQKIQGPISVMKITRPLAGATPVVLLKNSLGHKNFEMTEEDVALSLVALRQMLGTGAGSEGSDSPDIKAEEALDLVIKAYPESDLARAAALLQTELLARREANYGEKKSAEE